jgi:hypothetical protein
MKVDDLDTIAGNSFRNFHAKGLDYLCIFRSEELTIKAYFYDIADDSSPEIICPHDHRYPFATKILAGRSEHIRYSSEPNVSPFAEKYQMFTWMTPLNGGDGFSWHSERRLTARPREYYRDGQMYFCDPSEIHTIRIPAPETVLLLYQFADTIPIGHPTRTFVPGFNREPPALDGLYDRMTLDRAEVLMARLSGMLK